MSIKVLHINGKIQTPLWEANGPPNFDGPSISQGCQNLTEEPLQDSKMTVLDKLEFRDMNGPAPKGEIWTN